MRLVTLGAFTLPPYGWITHGWLDSCRTRSYLTHTVPTFARFAVSADWITHYGYARITPDVTYVYAVFLAGYSYGYLPLDWFILFAVIPAVTRLPVAVTHAVGLRGAGSLLPCSRDRVLPRCARVGLFTHLPSLPTVLRTTFTGHTDIRLRTQLIGCYGLRTRLHTQLRLRVVCYARLRLPITFALVTFAFTILRFTRLHTLPLRTFYARFTLR